MPQGRTASDSASPTSLARRNAVFLRVRIRDQASTHPKTSSSVWDQRLGLKLENYDRPGKVRELQNLLERAVILSKGGTLHLDPSWLPKAPSHRVRSRPTAGPEIVSDDEWRRRERANLETALKHTGGRIYGPDGAAELLGVKPTTL